MPKKSIRKHPPDRRRVRGYTREWRYEGKPCNTLRCQRYSWMKQETDAFPGTTHWREIQIAPSEWEGGTDLAHRNDVVSSVGTQWHPASSTLGRINVADATACLVYRPASLQSVALSETERRLYAKDHQRVPFYTHGILEEANGLLHHRCHLASLGPRVPSTFSFRVIAGMRNIPSAKAGQKTGFICQRRQGDRPHSNIAKLCNDPSKGSLYLVISPVFPSSA